MIVACMNTSRVWKPFRSKRRVSYPRSMRRGGTPCSNAVGIPGRWAAHTTCIMTRDNDLRTGRQIPHDECCAQQYRCQKPPSHLTPPFSKVPSFVHVRVSLTRGESHPECDRYKPSATLPGQKRGACCPFAPLRGSKTVKPFSVSLRVLRGQKGVLRDPSRDFADQLVLSTSTFRREIS